MIDGTLIVLAAVLLILTLAPLSRRKEWWVRGWEFPRLQLAVLCAALAAAGVARLGAAGPAGWIPVLVPLACLAWHVVRIVPFTPLRRREVADAGPAAEGETVRLLVANVQMRNREAERLVRLVRKEAPDILLALETDAFWGERLAALKDALPHAVEHPRDNTFGMHLLSRFPLEEAEIRFLVEADVPSIHCRVALPSGARVRLYCVHPAPPSPTENEESTERDAELVMIGRMAAECGDPAIVAGDLNDVAWSRTTRRFRRIAGMLDPRIGRGLFNTFHAKLPMLRWPLDHIFHSPEFRLVRLRRMPAIGSDHFPMLVELALSSAPAPRA